MTESEASTPITPTTINATTTPTTPTTPIASMPRSDLVTNATTTNHNNNNLKSINKTANCSRCARIIPFLANLHKECSEQREKLEVADKQIIEGTAKAEEQTSYINKLNKTIEELEDQIDLKTDRHNDLERKMEALKQDMEILNEKYVDEIDKVAELQHSKDIVEGEVEELTKALFEKANDMVAVIGKDKHKLEVQHKLLEKQLAETQERLAAESSQLNELREKLEQTMQHQQQSQPESKRSSSSDPSFRASIDFAELFGLRERAPEAAATLPNPTGEDGIGIDNELLLEFKEFVSQSNSIRLQKIHTILFMRHCLEDDVDPCMRFGSNSRVSSRRIVDAIVSNTCFIEEAPQGSEKEQYLITNPSPIRNSASKQLLWERLSGNNSKTTGCQCCGRSGPLQFQFRITNSDDWSLIDRYCRDRLVAVCEFYVFIRNIRQGLYINRTIEDLYSECLRLRLQMFYARLGALPSMLNTLGIKSNELASAKRPNYSESVIPNTTTTATKMPMTSSSLTTEMSESSSMNTLTTPAPATTISQARKISSSSSLISDNNNQSSPLSLSN
nr:1634_t:CDS:2 [Entrophospora candida]CAG8546149.1 9773_t:CDS:2 [Entrophospora candida]